MAGRRCSRAGSFRDFPDMRYGGDVTTASNCSFAASVHQLKMPDPVDCAGTGVREWRVDDRCPAGKSSCPSYGRGVLRVVSWSAPREDPCEGRRRMTATASLMTGAPGTTYSSTQASRPQHRKRQARPSSASCTRTVSASCTRTVSYSARTRGRPTTLSLRTRTARKFIT